MQPILLDGSPAVGKSNVAREIGGRFVGEEDDKTLLADSE